MKITFLGTNGWYTSETGNTVCALIETANEYIVLDAGNGIYKLDRHIPEGSAKPIYLFLSHFHLDHIEGLHTLAKFKFEAGLTIIGQKGTGEILGQIVRQPYTVPFSNLRYRVEVLEVPEDAARLPFLEDARFLVHASSCLGYRFRIDGKVIAYCTDTGVCDNMIELSRDADLLISECAFRFGQSNSEWPHMNPDDAVRVARTAGAKRLALTHFDAYLYPSLEDRKEIEERLEVAFPLIVARDGTEIFL